MANIYTRDDVTLSDQIYFLNGNSIVHDLNTDGALNTVPSLKLLNDINGKFDGKFESLSVDDKIQGNGKLIKELSQSEGMIAYEIKDVETSDVVGLNELIDKKISEISGEYESSEGLVYKITQSNGKVVCDFRKVDDSTVLSVSQSKVNGLTDDLNGIRTGYLKKDEFNGKLSSAFKTEDFRYDLNSHKILLNVQGKELSIDATELIKNKIIDKIEVEDISGEKYLKIIYKSEGSSELQTVYIKISDFFGLYKAGYGIKITDQLSVYVDTDVIADRTYVTNITDSLSSEIKELSAIDYKTLKFNGHITSINTVSSQDTISAVFNSGVICNVRDIYNGSFIQVDFSDGISAKTKVDNCIVGKGDYLIVHDHDKHERVLPASELIYGKNVFVMKAGVSLYDLNNLSEHAEQKIKDLKGDITSVLDSCVENLSVILNGGQFETDYDKLLSAVLVIGNTLSSLNDKLKIG